MSVTFQAFAPHYCFDSKMMIPVWDEDRNHIIARHGEVADYINFHMREKQMVASLFSILNIIPVQAPISTREMIKTMNFQPVQAWM